MRSEAIVSRGSHSFTLSFAKICSNTNLLIYVHMVYMVCTRVKKSSRTVVVRRPYVQVCVCKYMVDVYLQKEGQHG